MIDEGISLGNAANDLGWVMSKTGMMQDYDIDISFIYSLEEKKVLK